MPSFSKELYHFFFFNLFTYIYFFWLCWVFVSVGGLSLVAASGGHSSSRCAGLSSSRCAGLSPSRPLPLRGTGSRRAGSVVVAHGPSCSVACGIFPDQGSNPRPLHWQADSQPLRHQASPTVPFHITTTRVLVIRFLCTLTSIWCCHYFYFSHCDRCVGTSLCGINLHFLNTVLRFHFPFGKSLKKFFLNCLLQFPILLFINAKKPFDKISHSSFNFLM